MSSSPPLRLGKRPPGLTAAEAGKRVGRSARTIRRWTSEPREDYLARAQAKRARVKALRGQGMTLTAIAKQTGYSIGLVHRYATEDTPPATSTS